MDSQAALTPTNIVEAHGNDFTGAEPVGSNQQEHCVIAQSHCGFLVDALQKPCDCVPGKSARQLLKPVQPGSIDLAIQAGTHPAVGGKEPKQPADGSDLVLQACATQPLARVCDVGLNVAGLNSVERDIA